MANSWRRPLETSSCTRSRLSRNHDVPDFIPPFVNDLLDSFEPQWTLNRSDLAMPDVPVTGVGRPSVYAGGGRLGERAGPSFRFALDTPPQWDGKNPEAQATIQATQRLAPY